MTEGFSPEFEQAMERISAKRRPAPPAVAPSQKLLRRSGLMQREMPNTNFAVFNFIGWVHTRGALRAK